MIWITEDSPKKVSGVTSLFVKFNYHPQIVEMIKATGCAVYDAKTYTWEVPDCYLAQLLDTLTHIDDITLTVKNDPKKIDIFNFINSPSDSTGAEGENSFLVPKNEPQVSRSTDITAEELKSFKLQPMPHQIEAINFMLAKNKTLLLDSMGVGKTAEILMYASVLHQRGLIDHCLIICGLNSIKTNWLIEAAKFTNESARILGTKINKRGKMTIGTVAQRLEELKHPIKEFFVITNIESIRDADHLLVDAIMKKDTKTKKAPNNFGLIAVDEVHKCSNPSSKQGANLLKLSAPYMVAATGTLITNNPISCYLPLKWTDNDKATLTNYKAKYCDFGGFGGHEIISYRNLPSLQNEIQQCAIRRTFEDLAKVNDNEVMPKYIDVEYVDMSPEHQKFYEDIVAGVCEEADKITLNLGNLLALNTRLRQATSCPTALTTSDILSSKLEAIVERTIELVEQGEKVVIFSTFKESVMQLSKRLAEYNPLVNTGDIPDLECAANVKQFQEDPTALLFIGTTAKCSTGITLNAAKYLFMVDTPWTYADFDQACCRIYRVDNKYPACIKVFICSGTIDERVYEIVNTKKDLSDYLVDGKTDKFNENMTTILLDIIKNL